jgi:hypothetical protein
MTEWSGRQPTLPCDYKSPVLARKMGESMPRDRHQPGTRQTFSLASSHTLRLWKSYSALLRPFRVVFVFLFFLRGVASF